jgi:hypothetical protein
MGGLFLSSAINVFNFSILQSFLFYNEVFLDNLNTYEDEEVVFIGQRSGEPCNGAIFYFTVSKLDENIG